MLNGGDLKVVYQQRKVARGIMRLRFSVLAVLMSAVLLVLLFFCALAALWRSPAAFTLLGFLVALMIPLKIRTRRAWLLRGSLLALTLTLTVLLTPRMAREIQAQMDRMATRVHSQGGSSLTLDERLSVYGANMGLLLGGLALGSPEAARESWWLFFDGPDERWWSSDFAMRSDRVKRELSRFKRTLLATPPGTNTVDLSERRIAWPSPSEDPRASLALNPFFLSAKGERTGAGRWKMSCIGWVDVRYPPRSRVLLLDCRGVSLAVEESVFWALQEEKGEHKQWPRLYPYRVYWTWTIHSDDPRLDH